jgi:glutamate synthase domain-containing protein 1/glutamate synthase domain-containing protein 3
MYRNLPNTIEKLTAARKSLPNANFRNQKSAEEGGCGVTGFIASIPVAGRHIYEPSVQMHNRGNGKGGGIAAVGLSAEDLGVTQDVLDSHYLLQVALLDPDCRKEVEKANISPFFDVAKAEKINTVDDYREVEGLEVKPPDVWRYFVRVKPNVLANFADEHKLSEMMPRQVEDEFVYQNSIRLNQTFYASLGKQKAFVLSNGRNMMILKIVGYAEKVVQYYKLEDFKAHGWIAHQRYPTKGRVWHPGGAHPFSGLNEALVHNGDFANYHAVSEYLQQHNIFPQFLTDTEVSVLLFDLWKRTFNYPMEYIIEAMAPTTEHDFDQLPAAKQHIYRYLQSSHIAASPDGPWFFIIARNDVEQKAFQLIGITDTSMLRPQVFAIQDGEVQIGLVCSEKQAIDATLQNLAAEDDRFCPVADKYWNARGGSADDGGSFIFTVKDDPEKEGQKRLVCTNKFDGVVDVPAGQRHFDSGLDDKKPAEAETITKTVATALAAEDLSTIKKDCQTNLKSWDYAAFNFFCEQLVAQGAQSDKTMAAAIELLTWLNDHRYATGSKKRSAMLAIVQKSLHALFGTVGDFNDKSRSRFRRIDFDGRHLLRAPQKDEVVLLIDASKFEPEGDDCDSHLLVAANKLGWEQFVCYGYRGQRFCGCGLANDSDKVKIDIYDSSGDYIASGIDGLSMEIHGNAQDQLGQIIKRGKLVIHGDVGQTFMYGAKGGDVYVKGNAAGRPLINAVGRPRVVINGTCLDYLAESFMAGDPLNGGGFVILNGIEFDADGKVVPLQNPYSGSNLFSLASGGAIYMRDPEEKVVAEQLNGGGFASLSEADWELIRPYLEENERLFGISIENDLLMVNGRKMSYEKVFRKVEAVQLDVLAKESAGQEEWGEDWQE